MTKNKGRELYLMWHILFKGSRCSCFEGEYEMFCFSSDIDECVTGKNLCPYNRQCVNTFGSYYCKCQDGYDLKYVDGKYDCVGKVYEYINQKHLQSTMLLKVQIGFFQFQTWMSVQPAPASAATMLFVWTLKDPTSAGASPASEAMALNALVRSEICYTELYIQSFLGMAFVICCQSSLSQ